MLRHEPPGIRASLAMAPSLPRDQTERLLEEIERRHRERDEIRALLGALGPNWRDVREALNRLNRLVGE